MPGKKGTAAGGIGFSAAAIGMWLGDVDYGLPLSGTAFQFFIPGHVRYSGSILM